MTGYPDDVMKAARDAVADAYLAEGIPGMAGRFRAGEYDGTVDVQAAARAILAERERIAAIIRRVDGAGALGEAIAAAIRQSYT